MELNIIDISNGRGTYKTEMFHSILFESVLGIAAATYPEIHPTLEKPKTHWEQIFARLLPKTVDEVKYAEKHNTWKTLLQLLHQQAFATLPSFLSYIEGLSADELRYQALPFLGFALQDQRKKAAAKDPSARDILISHCRDHKFFPAYIHFICTVEIEELRAHLLSLMEGWHQQIVHPEESAIAGMLERDCQAKQEMQQKLEPEALVEWATGGIQYAPEPNVTHVLLVPHYIYRPWNIQADMEHTKIFYYPIADESLSKEYDPDRPPHFLVHRFKALGDEHRMRIVKMLHEKDHTLQELTDKLELAKSTVHHHLSMLRSAQLAGVEDQRYYLKRGNLSTLFAQWQSYLERGGDRHE